MKIFLNYKKLWILSACFFCVSTSLSQETIIKGEVKDEETPLAFATVSIAHLQMTTDSAGKFSFSILPGKYVITTTHTGYKIFSREIIVSQGSHQTIVIDMIRNEQMEEVVFLGSRSTRKRSNLKSAVPVDVFSVEKLLQTNQQGLIQMLDYTAPSFNAGGQYNNEAVTLRGLDPDHVLILVNGIRYHNTAWMNNGSPKSTLSRGSVGNDLNSIPFSAIEKVEILRDGASAQYGSDAIAGVINIRLKESIRKTNIQLHTGQFYAGDGLKITFGLNSGVSLGKKGFLNYSADFRYQGSTSRGGEYQGNIYKNYPRNSSSSDSAMVKQQDDSTLKARGIKRKDLKGNDGISQVNTGGILINGGYSLGRHSTLFWTGAVNYRENKAKGSYRVPIKTDQVDTELYPDGFAPIAKAENWDITAIAGIKNDTRNYWHWELTSSYGSNFNDNYVYNSNNASQSGLSTKATSFYLGKLIYQQYVSNLNFVKDFTEKLNGLKLFNLGFGAEWRLENYQLKAGDEASWENYDRTDKTQPGAQPSIGSVRPINSLNEKRTVSAMYIDLEIENKNNFLFDVAGRYEYYSDFGSNLAGKLAVRYKLSDRFSLRSSVSNGFRAPSMQQIFFSGTQSIRGKPITGGIFNQNSPITQAFKIPSLEAEKSVNLGVGFMAKFSPNINLTVDAYWIQIKNRIVLSGAFKKTNPDIDAILAGYSDIDQVQFYVNAINTRTRGIDAVLNGNWNIHKIKLGVMLAANFNRNAIYGPIKTTELISDTASYTNTLFGIEEKTALENDQPAKKIILSASVSKGPFGFNIRNTLFGNTATTTINTITKTISTATSITTKNVPDTAYENFSSKIISDLSFTYSPKSWITITTGANNIFNVYPDRVSNYLNTADGSIIYSKGASPFGYNGGYYFVSMAFKW